MTDYLIAVVDTDRKPIDGEFRGGEIVAGSEVRERLDALLARHGRSPVVNAQMTQEADAADSRVRRWRGSPMRLCGYLIRYDVYPIPAGDPAGNLQAGTGHWPPGPVRYPSASGALAGHLGPAPEQDWRARDLGRYHALATREDVAPFLAAYRPWQWVIATAVRAVQAGESYEQVERDLLAEIAERRQEAASS